jgi:hypothetical protein
MASVINKYSIDPDTGAMTDFIIEDVNEIPGALETICNMYPYIYEGKKPEGFVFDEDKSVKWNREQVELFNKNLDADREKNRKLRYISKVNLDKAVVDYILKYETSTNMSRAIANGLLAKIKSEHDDCWWHWISSYVEFADFIIDTLKEETK